jgi:hypothetical protein
MFVSTAMFALATLVVAPGPVAAEDPAPFSRSAAVAYLVTFAARSCPSSAEVPANQAANEVPETATPAGRSGPYQAGWLVDPDLEDSPGCTPLAGARFTLGSGQQRNNAALSTVTDADEPVATLASTDRLDATGKPTDASLGGAVTATLTPAQVREASLRRLWVQGGTPTEPQPAGLALSVLRCGLDTRSAGNTAWVSFPDGVRHVFCFAYYVRSPAAVGTVIVRAHSTRTTGFPQRFAFSSTLSPAGSFTVAGGAGEASFVRVADPTRYVLQPKLPAGWQVPGVVCTGGTASVDQTTGRAEIVVSAGRTIVCSYAFEPPSTASGLGLWAYAEGGEATFGLVVAGDAKFAGSAAGVAPPYELTVKPDPDGSAALATGADLSALPTGTYTVTLRPPSGQASQWSLASATCGGSAVGVHGWRFTVAVDIGHPRDCVLKLFRRQRLTFAMTTTGGVGTGGFAVVPAATTGPGWGLSASPNAYDTPTPAVGDLPAVLSPGRYLAMAIPPPSTMDGGWRLTKFTCDSAANPTANAGVLEIVLPAAATEVRCTAKFESVPVHRLLVTLRTDGSTDRRTGSVVLEVSCADGSAGRVVLAASDTGGAELPEPLTLGEPTTCTVHQPATGAPADVQTTSSARLDPASSDHPLTLPATIALDGSAAQYTLTVTTTYMSPGATGRRHVTLLPFGSLPTTLIGSGMMGIGVLTLLVLFFRRREAEAASVAREV